MKKFHTIPANTFQNPVIPGFHSDPSLVRDGETYYLAFSSFEFFPGVPLYKSQDLVNWTPLGSCLSRSEQLPLGNAGTSDGIYAPTFRKHRDTFYLITSNRCAKEGNHFFVTSKQPQGPYSPPVWIHLPDGSVPEGVDPSLFFDDDGKVYFSCVAWDSDGQGIGQAELNLATGQLLSPLSIIWHGTGATFPEGPHTYKIGGWYYLMIAEGGTEYGHRVSIARSRKIDGPYEPCPRNPILSQSRQAVQSCPIQGLGHGDLFEAHDGTWWLIVHGFRTSIGKLHHLGRETMLIPVTWDEDGWPMVENGCITETLPLQGIFSDVRQHSPAPFLDRFDTPEQNIRYQFLRNPDSENYVFDQEKPGLILYGSQISLNDLKSPTFIGIRQQYFRCEITVGLSFSPKPSEEAGLTVFQTNEHHYDLVVAGGNSSDIAFLRKTVGDISTELAPVLLHGTDFTLRIQAYRDHYEFFIEDMTKQPKSLGSGRTQLLSTEAMQYQNFTGTFFGLFAFSKENKPSPARFHFLSIIPYGDDF